MFKTLSGFGKNPNIASAIVIGIEPNWTQKIADDIAKTGKNVEALSIEENGDLKTIEKASRSAKKMVVDASEKQRKEFDVSSLVVGTNAASLTRHLVWHQIRPSVCFTTGSSTRARPY